MSKYSRKAFKTGITGLVLLLILLILIQFFDVLKSNFASILIGLLVFVIGIIGIMGFTYSLQGIREPNNIKKAFGILINLGIVLIFLFMILSNIYDMYKALGSVD